jgi:uncharacterized protein YbaA (DUF1428 family)
MKLPGTYIDGFLLAVPTAKLEEYRAIADQAGDIWMKHGALQYTECAADDLSTEFCRSFRDTANAKEDETVIFAWAVFADRAARDAANAKIMLMNNCKPSALPRMPSSTAKTCPLVVSKPSCPSKAHHVSADWHCPSA